MANQSKRGGKLVGASHAEGGIDIITPNGKIEAEGGEIIITKKASEEHCEELSRINQSGGGIAIPCDNSSKQPEKAADGAIISHLSGEHKEAYAMAEKILSEESNSKNKLTILTAWKKSLLPHFFEEENKIYNYRRDAGAKHFIAEHQKFKKLIVKIMKSTVKRQDIVDFANLLKHHIEEEEIYFTKMDEPMQAATGTKISSATTSELDKALSDLHRVEKAQKMMKEANAIIRSKKNVQERLVKEAGFSEAEAEKILKGDFRGRVGFSSYALTNNNANLKRLKDRVAMLQKKVEGAKAAATGGAEKYSFENGFIEVNYPADRVQIFFEGMPSADQRHDLKRNGWHWSYTNKAWQRKITPQAIRNATYLLKATKIEKAEPINVSEAEIEEMGKRGAESLKGELPEVDFSEEIKFLNQVKKDAQSVSKNNKTITYVTEKLTDASQLSEKYAFNYQDDIDYLKALNRLNEFKILTVYKNGEEISKDVVEKDENDINFLDLWQKTNQGDIIRNSDGHAYLIDFIEAERVNTIDLSDIGIPLKKNNWNKDAFLNLENDYWGKKSKIITKNELTAAEQKKLIEAQKTSAAFSKDDVFKGISHNYKNQYELNKAIESFITKKGDSPSDYTSDEKNFIRKYSGYGGLDKYGTTGKGGLFEYYTPRDVIEKMWALAYKYGYNNGPVLEPSVATGEFLQFAKPETRVVGFEISLYSSVICKILYPTADIKHQAFEQHFIKNNWTMKDNLGELEKFDLVIGNPPYGDFSIVASRYMTGMGEKDHTKAKNYVEYFIRRGLDLLNPKGLLIFIVGAQVKNGGTLFLDSGPSPVKEYLQKNCELLDAYRLPDSIFERTGVTSEIIVLQKN